jgi:hypothetical protein
VNPYESVVFDVFCVARDGNAAIGYRAGFGSYRIG